MNVYEVIRRPIVTEKAVRKKDEASTLCFEVAPDANKTADQGRRSEGLQGEGCRRSDRQQPRQASPARQFLRLSFGLEKSICPPRGGREDAGVRGDLEPCR